MLQARSRSVCIRVSAEELRILREACERTGTRTISELARMAMHHIIATRRFGQLASKDMRFWLKELRVRLINLQAEVERLQAALASRTGK